MGEEEGENGTFPSKLFPWTITDFTIGVTAIGFGRDLGLIQIKLSLHLKCSVNMAEKQDKVVGPMGPRQNPIHQNLPSAPDHLASGKYKASPI
ncbi:hypothetical protein LIER_02186 [Lithospermum erythrorhizon]|uniref:Uncharacterized protein n=1 Tax=Lithospermum erythrorhizon TaxID=34254 RepID=A0AAV3NP85_LITER